jgi:hypothetical protein
MRRSRHTWSCLAGHLPSSMLVAGRARYPPLCAGACCRLARSAASQIWVFCIGFWRLRRSQGSRYLPSRAPLPLAPGSLGGAAWPVSVRDQLWYGRVRFAGLPVQPAGQPGRGARRGRHLLGVLVLVRRGARPCRAPRRGAAGVREDARLRQPIGLHAGQIGRAGQQHGNFPHALTRLAPIQRRVQPRPWPRRA